MAVLWRLLIVVDRECGKTIFADVTPYESISGECLELTGRYLAFLQLDVVINISFDHHGSDGLPEAQSRGGIEANGLMTILMCPTHRCMTINSIDLWVLHGYVWQNHGIFD